MTTVKTTLNIDSEIMQKIKLIAINKKKTQTEIVNKMLKQGVINETEINENDSLEERINKNPKLKLMKKTRFKKTDESFEDLIGSIKAPKGFNSIKTIEEVRKGEY